MIAPGKYKLIATGEGQESFSKLVNSREPIEDLVISLKPSVDLLKSLEVRPPDPDGWNKWGKLFTQIFIGNTPISYRCHILNPEVWLLGLVGNDGYFAAI